MCKLVRFVALFNLQYRKDQKVCKKEVESCKKSEKKKHCYLRDSDVMTLIPQSRGIEQNQDGSSSKKEVIRICWKLTEPNHRFLGKVRRVEKVQFL